MSAVKDNTFEMLVDEMSATHSGVIPEHLDRCYQTRVLNVASNSFEPTSDVAQVHLKNGSLFIDNTEIPEPRFGPNFVAFCAQSKKRYISGVLNFTPDALATYGTLYTGSEANDARACDVAGVAPVTTYNTQIGTTGAVPPKGQKFPQWSPPAPAAWTKCVRFSQSYKFTEGKLPQPVFKIEGQDITLFSSVAVDPKTNNLIIALKIPESSISEYISSFGVEAPVAFSIEVATSGVTFKGVARKATLDKCGQYVPTVEEYDYEGTWDQSTAPVAEAKERRGDTEPGEEFIEVTSGVDLGITQLFNLQVDPKKLQKAQFDVLVENMKWALGDDTAKASLLNFFGEVQPEIADANRIKLIKKDEMFYTKNMAISYLGPSINKMTGQGAPTTRLTGNQQTDLSFFLRAGLPSEPGFTRQSHGNFLTAYTNSSVGLQDFIDDQARHTVNGKIDPSHNWGQKLFATVTEPVHLNMTYNGVVSGFGLSNFNRHSALLMALDPGGSFTERYHKLFLSRALAETVTHVNLWDKNSVKTWLQGAIEGIITVVAKKKTKLPVDDATQKEMEKLAQELEDAVDHATGVAELADALAELVLTAATFKGTEASFWEVLAAAETALQKAGYVFARAIFVIGIVGGMIAAIMALLRWNKLTWEEQGEAITAVVEVTAKIVGSIAEVWNGEWDFTKSVQYTNSISTEDNYIEMGIYTNEQTGDAAADIANNADDAWDIFAAVDVAVSIIGAAAAGVFAVLTTASFIADLIDHAWVGKTTLDGIIAAANICVAVTASIALFSAASAVPIIGAIAAIVGIIAVFIELFLPEPKPETPAEKFMKTSLIPALSGPEKWILDTPAGWNINKPVPKINPYNPAKPATAS